MKCCPHTNKDKAHCCCCVSLSLFCLVLSILILAQGIVLLCTSSIVGIIFGIFAVIFGLGGLFAVFAKSKLGIKILVQGWQCYVWLSLLQVIIGWIVWGIAASKDDNDADVTLASVIWSTVWFVVLCCVFWWTLSNLKSLEAVIQAGGSGWEQKSASQLRGGGGRKAEEV